MYFIVHFWTEFVQFIFWILSLLSLFEEFFVEVISDYQQREHALELNWRFGNKQLLTEFHFFSIQIDFTALAAKISWIIFSWKQILQICSCNVCNWNKITLIIIIKTWRNVNFTSSMKAEPHKACLNDTTPLG